MFVEPVSPAILAITHPAVAAVAAVAAETTPPGAPPLSPVGDTLSPVGDTLSPVGDTLSPVGDIFKGIEITTEISTETTTTPNPSSATERLAEPEPARGGGSGVQDQNPKGPDGGPGITTLGSNKETQVSREEAQTAPATAESSSLPPEPQNPVAREEVSNGQRVELIYPAKLTEREQADIAAQVYPLPTEVAQQMLDVIQARMQSGPPIRTNPAAVLRGIVRKYQADPDRFDPSAGFHVAEQRRQARARVSAPTPAPPARQPSPVWREQRERLRGEVSDLDYGVYIAPLHGREDDRTLWLEAPNRAVAAWVNGHLPLIEGTLRPHTELPVRVCIG
jgi:hypothetical protein